MNLCVFCKDEHDSHNLIQLNKLKISSDEKKEILKNISEVELMVNNIEELKNEFIKYLSVIQELNLIVFKSIYMILMNFVK